MTKWLGLSIWDISALIWFVFCYCGYSVVVARSAHQKTSSLRGRMWVIREMWMTRIADDPMRIIDANLLGHVMHSVTFFASTSILILAGLSAALANSDALAAALLALPMVDHLDGEAMSTKLLLPILIMIMAFFNHTWSLRQYNYLCAMIGALPLPPLNEVQRQHFIQNAAGLCTLASESFNQGIRAYYFALATLGWFIHPILFVAVTSWVVLVLYRRQFYSRSLKVLANPPT